MRWELMFAGATAAVLLHGACDSDRAPRVADAAPAPHVRPDSGEPGLDGSWLWSDGIPSSRACSESEQREGLQQPARVAAACVGGSRSLKMTVLVRPGGQVRRVLIEGDKSDAEERCVRAAFDGVFFECARATGFARTIELGGTRPAGE